MKRFPVPVSTSRRAVAALVAAAVVAALPASAALPRPSAAAFDKGARFTVAGYAGSAPLSGFPVLVRIAANSPAGFSYADLHSPANGADLAFVGMDGTGLPFEIDTWDPSGTSLIWVKLPAMTNGTQFVMCWGSAASGKTVCADSPFAGYVGVWHMSESSGTVADSSGHSLDAVPSGDGAAALSVAVSGPVGNGRQCSTNTTVRSYLTVPSYDSLNVGNTFAVSGWFNVGSGQTAKDARVFARKTYYTEANGWEVVWKNTKAFSTRGASGTADAQYSTAFGEGWKHFFIVYNGTTSTIYENGVQKARKTGGTAATDNNCALGIGDYPSDNMGPLVGSVDECRLLDAVPTADWAKAEYDSMSDAAFLTAGEAESYGASAVPVAGILVSPVGYTNATVVVALSDFGTGATSADGALEVSATADFAAPIRTETFSAAATGSRSFGVSGLSTNATYYVRAFVTNNLQAMTAVGPVSFATLAPGAPTGTVSLHERGVSSISATATVASSGTDAASAAVRLEASADAFATTVTSAWEDVTANASRVLTVSGLDPLTAYDVRLRLRNEWGIETVSDLGRVVTLPASGLTELYVDSLGNGNGTSPESALPTIRDALDIAGPGYTIWVRGGEGRAYGVTNDVDTIPIPEELAGLSIRAYAATPGDGGLASVEISDSFVAGGGRAHIVSNAAANVTIEGLDFAFGPASLGENGNSCALVWIGAPFATVENCRFRMSDITGYRGTGTVDGKAIVECPSGRPATNLVVRRCEFYNTRTRKRIHAFSPPVRCADGGAIVQNVFSNVNWTAATRGAHMSFVSNVVYGTNAETGQTGGLLSASGKTAEIAYNVFVEDPVGINDDNRHRDHVAFFYFWRAGTGAPYRIHHNTCIGGSVLVLGMAEDGRSETHRTPEIFCNLFIPRAAGTNILETAGSATMTNIWRNVPTSFRPGSTFRNNAWPDTAVLSGGSAAEQVTNYRLVGEDGLFAADNVVLDAPPDFVCTNDIYSADYYRYRANRHQPPDLGALGWRGESNEYPLWIGAKPPLYPSATMLILE